MQLLNKIIVVQIILTSYHIFPHLVKINSFVNFTVQLSF